MKHFLISIALALSLWILPVTAYGQANSTGQTVVLSNAVAVSGNGNSISTERWGAVRLAVTISASDVVSFEVYNGSAWTVTKNAFNVDAPTTAVNGATVSGTYIVVTNGMPFRAPVTHVSGTTTVTATQVFVTVARAVVGSSGGGGGGGDALTSDPLSQFASTTSSQFAGVISNETGTNLVVLNTSPTLVTPVLGVAAATSINKVTLTAPATGSTLTIADGKTATVSNTLTFTGTDSSSVAFGAGGTVVYTTTAQTLTNKTLTASSNVLGGVTMTLGSDADGDVYYRASNVLTRLAKGTAGQVLTMNAGATAPEWATGGGGANPAGSGSEVQYRSNGTTFGAVTGSSVSGGAITLVSALTMNVPSGSDTSPTDQIILAAGLGQDPPSTGYGVSMYLRGRDDSNNTDDMARLAAVWSDATSTSEDSDVTFQLRAAGAALAEKWRFSGLGTLTVAGTPTIVASTTNANIVLTPNGAGTVSQMNGATAQTMHIYGGFTDVSNYTRFTIESGSNYKEIKIANAGSFAGGEVLYISNVTNEGVQFKTNNASRIKISNGGHLLFNGADNSYDIGESADNRPRNLYVGTDVIARSVRGTAVAFASLPASPVEGMMVAVTDSNTATWGATVAGGGSNHILAYYNGTNWTVAGK